MLIAALLASAAAFGLLLYGIRHPDDDRAVLFWSLGGGACLLAAALWVRVL